MRRRRLTRMPWGRSPAASRPSAPPAAGRLLAAGLAASLAGAAGAQGSAFPLAAVAPSEECLCQPGLRVGWNAAEGRCLKGPTTSCADCGFQKQCARIYTVAGDGVRTFQGDCNALDAGLCRAATEASLSYPTSLAIDPENNIYISDHGNNRIRMLVANSATLVTIAGTGELGWAGDEGPATRALMRKPEGVALLPPSATTSALYFADYQNQRIRRIVLAGGEWTMHAVAGTGAKGDNPACDAGCDASALVLSYPRALAFASTRELFFVDSGNFKIRRLSADGQTASTFVGAFEQSQMDMTGFAEGLGGVFLPGMWEQDNIHVPAAHLYFLTMDSKDNLWYADSYHNMISMTPLHDRVEAKANHTNAMRYQEFYLLHFAPDPTTHYAQAMQVLRGVATWLQAIASTNDSIALWEEASPFRTGRSYWRYGKAEKGVWCERQHGECRLVEAQAAKFDTIMGFCFDAGGNMFLNDMAASETLYLNRPVLHPANATDAQLNVLTSRGCPCHQYWFEDHLQHIDTICTTRECMRNSRSMCQENPTAAFAVHNQSNANPILQDYFDLKDNITSLSDLPHCTTTNFCHGTATAQWCYTNPASTITQPFPCQGDLQARELAGLEWGWCEKRGLDVSFAVQTKVAFLGHEIRTQELEPSVNASDLQSIQEDLTQDLWSNTSEDFTSILSGFVYDRGAIANAVCDAALCCNMSTLTLAGYANASLSGSGMLAPQGCALDNMASLTTLQANLIASGGEVILVFGKVFTDQSLTIGALGRTLQDCEDECRLNDECMSYMVAYNATSGGAQDRSKCVYFSKSYPYYVYTLDRSSLHTAKVAAESYTEAERRQLRQTAFTRTLPRSRLFNWFGAAHVSDEGFHGVTQIDVKHEAGLLLSECKDFCIYNSQCTGVAYPGCYLLNSSFSGQEDDSASTTSQTLTMVFVKQRRRDTVEGVAGKPYVYTFAGEGKEVGEALVNRPAGCVIDSRGSLHIADVWNERIRKIEGRNVDCVYAFDGLDHEQQINRYVWAVGNVTQQCAFLDAANLAQRYADMQQEAIVQRNTSMIETYLCNYGDGPTDASAQQFYGDYTRNTHVLCELCRESSGGTRPSVCPELALCDCADAIEQALLAKVYTSCQAANAFYDDWHRWLSAYVTCWKNHTPASWLTNASRRANFVSALSALR